MVFSGDGGMLMLPLADPTMRSSFKFSSRKNRFDAKSCVGSTISRYSKLLMLENIVDVNVCRFELVIIDIPIK